MSNSSENEFAFKAVDMILATVATVVGIITLGVSLFVCRRKYRSEYTYRNVYELDGSSA
jgi:uncharacterized membrane protein